MACLCLLVVSAEATPTTPKCTALQDCSHQERTKNQDRRGSRSCGHRQYLREHGLAMLSDHGALVTVQRDEIVVEGLLGVLEHIVELCGSPFKDAAEVTGNQSPANRCSRKRRKIRSVNLDHPDVPWNAHEEGVAYLLAGNTAELKHPTHIPLSTHCLLLKGNAFRKEGSSPHTHCISLVHPPSRK